MTEPSEAALEIHQVAVACASLERLLKAHGALGRGMGELVHSVEEALPTEISSKLLNLSSIRNRVIHQAEPLGEVRLQMFMTDVREVEAYLEPIVMGHLLSGDKSDVADGLLPIRSAPIALTTEEAREAQVTRQRRQSAAGVVRVAVGGSYSPPPGHPARAQADRRAALRKVARVPWWYRVLLLVQLLAGGVMFVSGHGWRPLLPVLMSLVVALLVTVLPGVPVRWLRMLSVWTLAVTTALLLWLGHSYQR